MLRFRATRSLSFRCVFSDPTSFLSDLPCYLAFDAFIRGYSLMDAVDARTINFPGRITC